MQPLGRTARPPSPWSHARRLTAAEARHSPPPLPKNAPRILTRAIVERTSGPQRGRGAEKERVGSRFKRNGSRRDCLSLIKFVETQKGLQSPSQEHLEREKGRL